MARPSEGDKFSECGLAGRVEMSFTENVGDFDTFECDRGQVHCHRQALNDSM